jgi:hypothetical protein
MNKKIIVVAIISLFIAAFTGYAKCGTDACLFQPSITEVGFETFEFAVYHYHDENSCGCNHDCGTGSGTIQVTVYDARYEYVAGPFSMDYDSGGSGICNSHWTKEIEIPLVEGDNIKFTHPNGHANCYVWVDWD